MKKAFSIVLAGRPNVGKSTLFNRLVGKAMAMIDDQPGVTRDWRDGDAHLFDLHFKLFDTAGLEQARPRGSLAERTAQRTKEALERADVILLMVDGREGLTEEDRTVAREIRKTDHPVIILVNKCEGTRLPEGYHEAVGLGFESVIAVSAKHGDNMNELYEAIRLYAPEDAIIAPRDEVAEEELPDSKKPLHVAIVGRPNAGKSTLVNSLVGEQRMLTGPEPGLTRDSIHIKWEYQGRPIRLVDTAGMRRRSRVDERLERMSVQESLRAIRLAHVVILVIDAERPFDKQDYTIAQHVVEEGRALVVAVNKWDAITDRPATLRFIQAKIEASLAQISGVQLVTMSALKGDGMNGLMRAVTKAYEVWNKRVSTGQINRWFAGMIACHPPPITGNHRIKPRYVTQLKSRPPTFVMWGNKLGDLPDSYVRFLTNGLRKTFDLGGTPIRWILKKGENPYSDKDGKK